MQIPLLNWVSVEPLAGLAASRALELAAREHGVGHVRAAREAGHSWQDIGNALGLDPGDEARQVSESVAEATSSNRPSSWWEVAARCR